MIQILEAKDLTTIPGNAAHELNNLQKARAFDSIADHQEYAQAILSVAKKYVGKSMKQEKYDELAQILNGAAKFGPELARGQAERGFLNWILAAAGLKVIGRHNCYESITAIGTVLTESNTIVRYTEHQRLLKEELERRGYIVTLIGS